MLLPALQHGEWKTVRSRVKAVVRRVLRGESFLDVMTEGGTLDTATTEGMLVVAGTLRAGTTSFYCYEPWKHLLDAISALPDDQRGRDLEEAIFRASITVPWGVLGLMAPSCTLWFAGHRDWEEPFLRAAIATWDEIDAVGERYYVAFQGQRMWAIANSLQHVLARAGVTGDRLREPLPPGGPAKLLKYARLAN